MAYPQHMKDTLCLLAHGFVRAKPKNSNEKEVTRESQGLSPLVSMYRTDSRVPASEENGEGHNCRKFA